MSLVTEQNVVSAANELKAEGRNVGYRAIRDPIGGGSPRNILAHLRNYWSTKEAKTLSAATDDTMTTGDFETGLKEATHRIKAIIRRRLSGELAPIIDDAAGAGAHSQERNSRRLRRNRHD